MTRSGQSSSIPGALTNAAHISCDFDAISDCVLVLLAAVTSTMAEQIPYLFIYFIY